MRITDEIKISENGFVFNSKTGDSFNLNPIGLQFVKRIKEGKDFEEIKSEMLGVYDVNDLNFERDFFEFLALLKHHQIVASENPMEFI